MMYRKLIRTKRFNSYCFVTCGQLMSVNSHGMCSLTLVKMAVSHMTTCILVKSSARIEESHMIAILKHLLSWYVVFKNKIPVIQC